MTYVLADDVSVQAARQGNESRGGQTLIKALSLLDAVAEGCRDLNGVAKRAGVSRSTAHRLLSFLARERYLRRAPGDGYSLGPKLISLGFQAHRELHLPGVARPWLESLAASTTDTVHLAVLDGPDVVYIDKVTGSRGLQMASSIGVRFPAQFTGLGKAIVAALPREEWRAHFFHVPKRTAYSIDTFERLSVDLEQSRARGYALDREENEPGVCCIAAAIRGADARPVAGLSVSGAAMFQTVKRIEQIGPLITRTANRIAAELGWHDA